MSYSLIIVDDHELFSVGLKSLIEENTNNHVLSRFKNGKDALDFLRLGNMVDLALIDLNMPIMDGAQLLSHMGREFPKIKKLVISMHEDQANIKYCKDLGADGFISKDIDLKDLQKSITAILNGKKHFLIPVSPSLDSLSENIYDILIKNFCLTKREVEVLQLILNQFVNSEIAEKLNCSPLTIKTHRRNIFKKLGVRNLAGLVTFIHNKDFTSCK